MLSGHSEHRKGKELSYNPYTPCKGGERFFLSLYFSSQEILNWGARGKGWEKTLRIIQPRSPGCQPVAGTGGKGGGGEGRIRDKQHAEGIGGKSPGVPLPSLRPLLCFLGESKGLLQGCLGVLRDSWRLPPDAFSSTMLQTVNWGPEKLTLKNGTLAKSPGEASCLWPLRVRPSHLFVRGIRMTLLWIGQAGIFYSVVVDSPLLCSIRVSERRGRGVASLNRPVQWLCFNKPRLNSPKAGSIHRRRTS